MMKKENVKEQGNLSSVKKRISEMKWPKTKVEENEKRV